MRVSVSLEGAASNHGAHADAPWDLDGESPPAAGEPAPVQLLLALHVLRVLLHVVHHTLKDLTDGHLVAVHVLLHGLCSRSQGHPCQVRLHHVTLHKQS